MKRYFILLFFFTLGLPTYSQHINSLNKPEKGLFDFFRKKSEIAEFTTDSVFVPLLSSLNLSFDLVARPEDFAAGNYLSPKGTGNYSETLWGKKNGVIQSFRGMYEINVEIQSPSTTTDSTATLNRILSSGGVGNLSGVFKTGFFSSENRRGLTISLIPGLSWQNSKVLKDTISSSFIFGSIKTALTCWTGPLLITIQGSYNSVLGEENELIAKKINNKFIWTGMLALKLSNDYYLQFKTLLQKGSYQNEMTEISLVKTLSL